MAEYYVQTEKETEATDGNKEIINSCPYTARKFYAIATEPGRLLWKGMAAEGVTKPHGEYTQYTNTQAADRRSDG